MAQRCETTSEKGKKCVQDCGSYFDSVCLLLGTENYCLTDCLEKNSKFLECLPQSIRREGRIRTQQDEGQTLHILLKCIFD